jgi:uncharacterized protein YqjF (DUF2071 family)
MGAGVSSLEFLDAPVRQRAGLEQTAHRPWPLPDRSWTIGQTWDDLLFLHWRVEADELRRLVPARLELDEHDGSAWLGITPFLITGFRLRGTFAVPVVSTFPELNVRTYVTYEDKPGIWFFSLDTSSRLAVEAARLAFRLPYFHARTVHERRGGRVEFSNARRDSARPFVFEIGYRDTAGDAFEPSSGSLEHFLTERYCLYAADDEGLFRADIHHPPWRLRPAEASIDLNTMPPNGVTLAGEALCHLAERQDVVIWPLEKIPANEPQQTARRPGRAGSSR